MGLDKNIDNMYWQDNQELGMKEFHYTSSDLVFVAYYTKDNKLAFVFNNTVDKLHLAKKLIIDPLQSEIDIENPIIKWDQIVKENFNIDPVVIRPKNGNLYEKFDIDYIGLSKYDDLVNDSKNINLRRNLLIFDIKRNLDSAYKKEESVLLELNNSSKTVETTTKTLEKLDVTISNLNKKIEKLNIEDIENKEEKQNELNEKLYKKLSEQKGAKRRLKRAKSRYLKADKNMESIKSFLKSAKDFLKNNKEVIFNKNNDSINDGIGIKNSSISELSRNIQSTIASKKFNLPSWKKMNSDFELEHHSESTNNNYISNDLNKDYFGKKHLEGNEYNKNIVNSGVDSFNLSDKLLDIKNKIIEKSIKSNIQVADNTDVNSSLGRKNRIIAGTLGDLNINQNYSNSSKEHENSMGYKDNLNKKITDKNIEKNKSGVFRYSSGNRLVINRDDVFKKFKKRLLISSTFLFLLLCLVSGYFVINKSNRVIKSQQELVVKQKSDASSVTLSDSDLPVSVKIKDDVKLEKIKKVIVNKNTNRVKANKNNNYGKSLKNSVNRKEKIVKIEKNKETHSKDKDNEESKSIKNSINSIRYEDNSSVNDENINSSEDDTDYTSDNHVVGSGNSIENQDIADTSLSLSGNSSSEVEVVQGNGNGVVDSSILIPNQFGVEGIKYDNNLINARNNYIDGVIGYLGSVNRPLDIMMALGEAFVNQDNEIIDKYIVEVARMNDLWNDFRLSVFNSYYTDTYLLKDGIIENEELYNLFVDDEKLLRSYSDAFQNLFLIVRYMLDNYDNYIDNDLFEEIKRYSSTPEMLGYHVKKTNLIIDAYNQIKGKKVLIDDSELPTNEEVNNLYANKNNIINTKQKIVLKNVNNSNDTIETDVMLNNIKPDKDYQIRLEMENNTTLSDKEVNSKKEIINLDIESLDGVKGTYILDGVQNYKHSIVIDNTSNSEENLIENYNTFNGIDLISVSLSIG